MHKVALLSPLLSSSSGGLASSVPNLAWELAKFTDIHPVVFGVLDDLKQEEWARWGPHVVKDRASFPKSFFRSPSNLKELFSLKPKIVDVQGIWSYSSIMSIKYSRAFNRPYVVTPRGMLDPWALKHGNFKKRAALFCFEREHLSNASVLRATADMEAQHFRDFGLTNPIAVIPNGVKVPELSSSTCKKKQVLFLSRIHPKKGIDLLLKSWSVLGDATDSWSLVIAGIDEGGYEDRMRSYARDLGIKNVIWRGPVFGVEKAALYQESSFFVLPTHAENFGLVVAEALANGLPVVTTKNAPWEGLVSHECGLWIDLNEPDLVQAIRWGLSCPEAELLRMGALGRDWMMREFSLSSVALKTASLYRWLLGLEEKPSFVVE